MKTAYPACFFQEEDGISVIFPDLHWLSTCGKTQREAEEMAADCLSGYLKTAREDGDAVPPPSGLDTIRPDAVARELDLDPAQASVRMIPAEIRETARKGEGDRTPARLRRVWANPSGSIPAPGL